MKTSDMSCIRLSSPPSSPGSQSENAPPETDKRLRREIANSNERRRMQSINSGFQTLKGVIPHQDGEKLSKAAILQQTSEFIQTLVREKERLISQNASLKQMLTDLSVRHGDLDSHPGSPPAKRKKRDTESSDEGIGLTERDDYDDIKKEILELRSELQKERQLRHLAEEKMLDMLEVQKFQNSVVPSKVPASPLAPSDPAPVSPVHTSPLAKRESSTCYAPPVVPRRHSMEETTRPETVAMPTIVEPVPPPRPSVVMTTMQPVPLPAVTQEQQHPYNLNSSMSRRNLETIVEAIRHLEGDAVLEDAPAAAKPISPLRREDSYSGEESKCESSSGADSPPYSINIQASAIKQELPSHKYPITMQVLHRPTIPPFYHLPHTPIQLVQKL
ncbi:unnamed protein product [Owenia fusiformis]|uniref:Uncharacterized protein n=1 Tax=Owenia fusiformis TaxID=6347 RepID=A0A8J1TI75_OWEFU|nr:unnamed protein product [Owenia fusiformis]